MKFLNKAKFFAFFSLLCLISFLILMLVNKFFLIKNIHVAADRKFILINKDKLVNKSLLLVNKEQIARDIIKENFILKTAVVEKVWPDSLKISVSFYDSCALLVVSSGYFDLSCNGRILQKIKNVKSFLPVISYYQKLNNGTFQTGDWINYRDIRQSLFFIDKLKQINLVPLTIDIKGQDMLVFKLVGNNEIIFSNSKDYEIQSYQLELIIRKFKIEGKEFKKIDLRFNKPIIQF